MYVGTLPYLNTRLHIFDGVGAAYGRGFGIRFSHLGGGTVLRGHGRIHRSDARDSSTDSHRQPCRQSRGVVPRVRLLLRIRHSDRKVGLRAGVVFGGSAAEHEGLHVGGLHLIHQILHVEHAPGRQGLADLHLDGDVQGRIASPGIQCTGLAFVCEAFQVVLVGQAVEVDFLGAELGHLEQAFDLRGARFGRHVGLDPVGIPPPELLVLEALEHDYILLAGHRVDLVRRRQVSAGRVGAQVGVLETEIVAVVAFQHHVLGQLHGGHVAIQTYMKCTGRTVLLQPPYSRARGRLSKQERIISTGTKGILTKITHFMSSFLDLTDRQ